MLLGALKINRRKIATFLAVLYAFCVLAPHVAVALVHSPDAIHCLTQAESTPHQHGKAAHVHADSSAHQHSDGLDSPQKSDEKGSTTCCGLFFMTALAADTKIALGFDGIGEDIAVPPPRDMGGHPPGRTIRPPIA